MLIVGHLVIAPLLFIPWVWQASPAVVIPVALVFLTVVTLSFLPWVKGAFIGHMAYLRATADRTPGHTADQA